MAKRILVVDDEETIRKLLRARFEADGWEVQTCEDGRVAVDAAAKFDPNVVVTDIKMPGMDGFAFIKAARGKGVECPVVVITGHGDKEYAIEAVHNGAHDYVEKPFDMDVIADVAEKAYAKDVSTREQQRTNAVNAEIATQVERERTGGDEILLGKSQHISSLKEMIQTIAESFRGEHDPVVLVTGESGTGKEVVARYIHQVTFGKNKPFIAVNCAAFPEHLLESELFGYEKGAFTGAANRKLGLFELASGGTIFLDEIGEMDIKMQAKLLRVLQERVLRRVGGTTDIVVKPHIVAATNRDLSKMVTEKSFREDLFYRLNTIPIQVAPLRARAEDVEVLANAFLKQLTKGRSKRFTGFSTSATRALAAYSWPGNVRELKSVIERAVILEKGPLIELSHLRQEHLHAIKLGAGIQTTSNGEGQVISMKSASTAPTNSQMMEQVYEKGMTQVRSEMDDSFVKQVLTESLLAGDGNVSAVARKLKLDRANLLRMLRRFDMKAEMFRQKKAG